MGWGMWILMIVGTAAFWAVVLMGIHALFPASTPGEHDRDGLPPPAVPQASTGDRTLPQPDPSGADRPPHFTLERHP